MAALRTNFFLVDVDDAMVDVGTIAPYDEERRNALEEAPALSASRLGNIRLVAPRANVGTRSALARDSAPLVNSPSPRGTVDRRVTVPERRVGC